MIRTVFFALLLLSSSISKAQQGRLQFLLDSLRIAGNYPGLNAAIVFKDNTYVALAAGFNDKEKQQVLKTSDRMLQGSVGKTYAAAITLQLINEGKITLDEKVSAYLGLYPWYQRLPNAATITVRMLMNHTSGIMRYEFKPQFTTDLTANPTKHWQPEELLQYIFDQKATFPAGEGWDYSDTNFILLGMIIETVTGKKYYELVKERLLKPFGLNETFPSDSRNNKGLAQGYAGAQNEFGGKDRVIGDDGLFIINPQFEWTGGGMYSTTADLAKWGKLLYEGKVADTALMLTGAVPAKIGRDSRYGLGVIIRQTPLGTGYGHSGFFPGYQTELLYFPSMQVCIAVQANSSDFRNLKLPVLRALVLLAMEVQRGVRQ